MKTVTVWQIYDKQCKAVVYLRFAYLLIYLFEQQTKEQSHCMFNRLIWFYTVSQKKHPRHFRL